MPRKYLISRIRRVLRPKRAKGVEPSENPQELSGKTQVEDSGAANAPVTRSLPVDADDLRAVVEAWPILSELKRAMVLELIKNP
jgi:hypothetical protein